jgi:hypothetical protein
MSMTRIGWCISSFFLAEETLGVHEMINRHGKIAMTVVVCLAAAGLVTVAIELRDDDGKPPSKNYFSVDDGTTWFVDSASKLPPFDHGGGTAVRCYLFTSPKGKFVGLLEKYSDDTRAQLANKAGPKPTGELPVLVKKPGEKDWQSMGAAQEAMLLMQISGPDGSGIERIMP